MASLLKIGYYSTMINQMRQGPSYNGKRNKAKPLLLWTFISLVENNILKKNIITLEFLEDRYYKILNDFNVPRTVIIYPFFYLKNDGFWHLKWKYDKEAIIQTPTFKFINNNIDYRKTEVVIRIEINVANMFARYISIAFLSTKPISSFSSP